MTFQNIQSARVMRAVVSAFGLAVVLSLAAQMVIYPFLPDEMRSRMLNMSMNQAYDEVNDLTSDYGTEYAVLLMAQWALALLATAWMGRWAAKQATSPEQAAGYGAVVGLGVMFSYGVLCIGFSLVNPLLRLGFFLLLPLSGILGGRWAGANLDKFRQQSKPYGYPPQSAGPSVWGSPASSGPDVYYNMGVTAAMGARREEARGHFTHVLQMNPYYLPAWLQLANLADTPEQAWNYIQQARAINANDPAVVQAVNIIWPKVAANAARGQQSLLREIEGRESATEIQFPVIQPPPVIVPPSETPPETPASELPTDLDILGEHPTLRELPPEPPTQQDQFPAESIPPSDDRSGGSSGNPLDNSSGKKENPSDPFDPWG